MGILFRMVQICSDFLWQFPMLFLLPCTHLFFTFYLGLIQRKTFQGIRLSFRRSDTAPSIRPSKKPVKTAMDRLPDREGTISPFETLATSLAATIGTGNIVGVSTAVALGGAGAVFWCFLTGIFGIATSYGEAFLSVKYRVRTSDGSYLGGPMYILRDVLNHRLSAKLFAFFTICASFGIGSSVQSYSICGAVRRYSDISPHLIGIVVSVLSGLVMIGGVKQIAKVCTFLVPFMSLFYLLGCLFLLVLNRHYLADSLLFIVKSAFCGKAIAGGFGGFAVSKALRIGISRGLFSNEAGLGSLPLSAAAARTDSAVRQALISMTGTFWDTVVICAITGLVIVSSMLKFPALFAGGAPEQLCFLAFDTLPFAGGEMLSVSLILFAFATIIGWCYFGECGAKFLFKQKGTRNFQVLYLVAIYAGAVLSLEFVFNLSDIFNALMSLPNLFCLFALRDVIRKDTVTQLELLFPKRRRK